VRIEVSTNWRRSTCCFATWWTMPGGRAVFRVSFRRRLAGEESSAGGLPRGRNSRCATRSRASPEE
jgi:hypothetical protein